MTLVIEDGSLVDGANSYITAAELTTYMTDRGYSITVDAEPYIIRAFDYMLGLDWIEDHSEAYTVTDNMKKAQCEIAYRLSAGLDPSSKPAESVKRKQVDTLSVEYFSSSNGKTGGSFLDYMPQAKIWLTGLVNFTPAYMGRA